MKKEDFIAKVAPMFRKHADEHGIKMISVAIAQSAIESGWGESNPAKQKNNILGIGPGMRFDSWDDCVAGYYTKTVAGKSGKLQGCTTFEQYYQVLIDCNYVDASDNRALYKKLLQSIISDNNLEQYDDGTFSGSSGASGMPEHLYEYLNTKEDALMREVAYIRNKGTVSDPNYEYCKDETRIRLSYINYTEWFEAFYQAGITLGVFSVGAAAGDYDLSALEPKVQEVVKFLIGKGLNSAAACGVAGNIYHESHFDTASVGDHGTSFGICQWHNDRGTRMKEYCGSDWSSNMTKQLEFLWMELENSYGSVMSVLKSVPDTEEGCKQAADAFVRKFEIPANVDYQSTIRQETALGYFKKVVKIVTPSGGSANINMAGLSAERRARIQRAESKLGCSYVWGAVGPNTFDCSGLVSYVLSGECKRLGTASTFAGWPRTSNPLPGDICATSSHCGIYIGDGKMIHAPQAGDVVKVGPVQSKMVFTTYGNA